MTKRIVPYVLCAVCASACFASIADDPETVDGRLTSGEYVSSVSMEYEEQLFVMGGGANRIEAWNSSYLEVQYTSTPLSNSSGIYDIMLGDYSELLYLGGITEEITLYDDTKAYLRGGRIDYITLLRRPVDSCLVTVYCQDGWNWLYDAGDKSGITGLWENGTDFEIQFIDVGDPYPATWNYINVEVVPEPATLLLLGFGTLMMKKKH